MTTRTAPKYVTLLKQLNKLRLASLIIVFTMLITLPLIAVYQTLIDTHSYDLLAPSEKVFFDTMESITAPVVQHQTYKLDYIKGTTWSGDFFGYSISDPLAVVSQTAATKSISWSFIATMLLPLVATLLLGRFFCGWICPATFVYELNSLFKLWLERRGVRISQKKFDRRFKYLVLIIGLVISTLTGVIWVSAIYPPAILGREFYYRIVLGGFGSGGIFFLLTLIFDTFFQRRAFCRYVCPGGALYSLLGRYRPVRIQRIVNNCNDCVKCNVVCEFGLKPMSDQFGQECNNCTACIAACPEEALEFKIAIQDLPPQGPGHQSERYLLASAEGTQDET